VNIKNRKIGALMSAGIFAMVTVLGAGVANADPSPAGTFREIALVGSDTTESVMQIMAEDASALAIGGVKKVASYNATGAPATIVTHSGCTAIARPNGSGAGRTALLNSLTAANGCLQGARSSSFDATAATPKLVYIPFAAENVSFAVSGTSNIPLDLQLQDVKDIYSCNSDPTWKAMLPQSNSGTRKFWITQVYTGGVLPSPVPSCVENGTDEGGVIIEEHRGTQVNNNEVVPYSVGQWESQTADISTNFRGTTRLGQINGTNPFADNFAIQRDLFNVFPVSNLTGTDAISQDVRALFVGSGSRICSAPAATAITQKFGFRVPSNCGVSDVAHQTS
jgi:ABC-type phosphate transport system substrate-binding protein